MKDLDITRTIFMDFGGFDYRYVETKEILKMYSMISVCQSHFTKFHPNITLGCKVCTFTSEMETKKR